MTIGLVLTIIFLVLKLIFGAISWPLWACFLPLIIEGGLELLIFCLFILAAILGLRTPKRKRVNRI